MRRPAPRPLGVALEGIARERTPPTLLGSVQLIWREVVGAALAGEAEPLSEHDGTLTVGCRSAAWTHELDLLGDDLRGRLNDRLGGGERVRRLRFVVAAPGSP